MKNGIIREYDLVCWPVQLVVVIGDMEKEVNDRYKPADEGYNVIGKPKNTQATTYHVSDKKNGDACLLVWYPKAESCVTSAVAHEAGHVALEIFQYAGSKVHFDNQEPFCYLLGNVARLIAHTLYEIPSIVPPKMNENTKPKSKKK